VDGDIVPFVTGLTRLKDGSGHLLGSREQGNSLPIEIFEQST
jgi:hypothetical protein